MLSCLLVSELTGVCEVDAEYLGSLDRIYVFRLLSLLSGFGIHLFHGIASTIMVCVPGQRLG